MIGAGKYFMQFSIRRDATTALNPNNQYGNFPGYSIGWRLGQEKILANSSMHKLFNDVKFRGSYAVVGNVSRISLFNHYGSGSLRFNRWYSNKCVVGTPDLKWETNKKYDVGIDLSLNNSRITIDCRLV